ncbi:hypothetical protein [Maribellus sediminis]|uniref:hypothetical protein n=1 Tax=Maribellus sediminis TaxID=2696285 RepID=UPI0014314A05|nr:hypothetical protein [Maribellus sediminis]
MQRIVFLAFVLLVAQSVSAQSFVIGDISTLSDHIIYRNSKNHASIYDNIDGIPYLTAEFIQGEVLISDSLRIVNVPLRYNILNDKIEFRNENDQVLELNMEELGYRFWFDEHVFVPGSYVADGEKKVGILEQLDEGRLSLFKKYSAEFKPATKAIGFQDAEPDRIERKDEIYLLAEGQGIPKAIKANKKEIFAALKPFKSDIEQFAKSEKLNPRKEADFIELVRYCNSAEN